MISVEDWAEIRRLHRSEQMPIRVIARKLGISRNTVRRAIADDAALAENTSALVVAGVRDVDRGRSRRHSRGCRSARHDDRPCCYDLPTWA